LRTHHGTIYPQLVVNDEAQCKAGLGLCIPYYVVLKKGNHSRFHTSLGGVTPAA